jgi:hypothetical protein
MFTRNSLFVIGQALAIVVLFGVSVAQAHGDDDCYTVASLQGSWTVVATFGANFAKGIGTRTVDANGNFAGTALVNAPANTTSPSAVSFLSWTGARTITNVTQQGTFTTVNCDGTGQITRVLNGTIHQVDDFVITRGIVAHGRRIATEIQDVQEVQSAATQGGFFVTRVHTRQPAEHDQDLDQ